jgi:hypothetical protein
MAGCETESSSSSSVSISPSSATLYAGESREFTASGGDNYEWSLSSSDYGLLSTKSGGSTVYTSMYEPDTGPAVAVTLKVVATIDGAGPTSKFTNDSGSTTTRSGEAVITHIGPESEEAEEEEEETDLSVSPGSGVTLIDGEAQIYTVSGGDGTYSWALSDGDLGWISTSSGASTTYTSTFVSDTNTTEATQFLTVTSGESDLTVSITHE